MWGSSPLARGLQHSIHQSSCNRRIIPARAGFTAVGGRVAGAAADHPRSRGVYRGVYASFRPRVGSSPLARGLRPPVQAVQVAQGIIPARAGFTGASPRPASSPSDHPRSRGVYLTPPHSAWPPTGSSPLARGLPMRPAAS